MSPDDHADRSASPAIVLVASGGAPACLVIPPEATLGRRVQADGASHELADERMSREHARVAWERDAWTITDLGSRNGTYVGGERIRGAVRRRGEQILRLGHSVFLLVLDAAGLPVPEPEGGLVIGPALARVHAQIRALAAGDRLLIHGEPGAGKQVAARVFHAASPRAAGTFVAVDCAALPEALAAQLVFGRASRQGAGIQAITQLDLARGGTLMLDELDALPERAQAALIARLDRLDAAIVVAGNNLRSAVATGAVREDLYLAFQPAAVTLPPLRARRLDLARLVHHTIAGVAPGGLAPHAELLETCLLRPWPANVRELQVALRIAAERAAGASRAVVRIGDLPEGAGQLGPTSVETAVERKPPPAGALDRDAVVEAMRRANGLVSVAARALGIHRAELHRLLERFDVVVEDE